MVGCVAHSTTLQSQKNAHRNDERFAYINLLAFLECYCDKATNG